MFNKHGQQAQGGFMNEIDKSCCRLPAIVIAIIFMTGVFPDIAGAGMEWEVLKTLNLDEQPLDIANSLDGTKAYILSKKCIYYLFN